MKRHYRRIRQVITGLREDLENLVLPLGISAVGFQNQRERGETIAVLVGERRIQLDEKTNAGRIQRFARAHDDARRNSSAMFVQPARALDPSLKESTVKGVLEISRAQRRHCLDDFHPSEVGRVAHRGPQSLLQTGRCSISGRI
jgi:hypothetical protein